MPDRVRILAIDGGGIRGLLPAQILVHVERRLAETTGNPDTRLTDHFDFFAGTSTGGILTCLHLMPSVTQPERPRYGASDVADIYVQCGGRVFQSSWWQRLRSGAGFFDDKFPVHGIEEAFREYFGELWLKDLIRPCLIPAYDIQRGKTHFFTQHTARSRPGHDFYVRDVARATSAAPTYFKVALVHSDLNLPYPLIDGGVFANNPALCAYAEVNNMYPFLTARDMVILSIGTGRTRSQIHYEVAKDLGKVGWAAPLIDIMVSGVTQSVDYQLRKIFEAVECGDQYLRIDPFIEGPGPPRPDFDDASPENLEGLRRLGDETAEKAAPGLDAFTQRLLHP